MIAHPNVERNSGRGSLLFIHKTLCYKELKLSPQDDRNESLFAEIKLNHGESLLCACIYRHGDSTEQENDKLMSIMKEISTHKHSHKLIMGDFNIKNIDWENTECRANTNDISYRFLECVRDCYYFQHITEPTRQRGTDRPSTLDLIFTNEEDMIENLNISAPLGKSDHSVLNFDIVHELATQKKKIKVLYEKADYKRFNELMGQVNWEDTFKDIPDDVNQQWELFKQKYIEAEAQCVPKKVVYIDGKLSRKFSVPLDSTNLKKLKRKNKLWSKIRKNIASEEEKLQYNKLRNQIRRMTRKGKKLMEKQIASMVKNNPKGFWKYAQSKLKTKAGIPDLVLDDDLDVKSYTKNDHEKAEAFINQFSSVFTQETDVDNMPPFNQRDFANELSDIDITENMVKTKLLKLKVNKSPGPDKIHPRVLREIASSITTPITIIFRTSIRCKALPKEWKHATISAIYKKGNKTIPLNYRPVSLTCIICKIMEGIIRDHVIAHMKQNNLFSSKQFGFISGRSTTLQLLHVLSIWCDILDEGGTVDAIYCDFMKAFDKVPHHRLLYKIEKYGVTGNILGWIKSFLLDRTQCVLVNEACSKSTAVTSGIPQGSVLGPLLFVIYINDMPEVVDKNSHVFLFADDTKSFRHIRNKADNNKLQSDVNNLVKWSDTWLLKFHPDKCASISIRNKSNNNPPHTYYMKDHPLKQSKCEKDIGVQIDEFLSFDTHINQAINKSNRILAIVRKTFDYMDKRIFMQLYKGLIRPNLEYAMPVWKPYKICQIEALENVQRRATKMVSEISHLPYNQRLRVLKLPTLSYRRERGDMIETYKLTTDNLGYDKSLPSIMKYSSTDLRGHNKKLFVGRSNRDVKKYCFIQRIVKNWNSLPNNIVNSGNIIEFERLLDSHWADQDILYDNFKGSIDLNPVR